MSAGRVGIILQARTGSTRLPGKVLRPLAGVPMLVRIVRRLKAVSNADLLIVATSDRPADDDVAALARECGAEVFQGSEDDVLERYAVCAETFGLDLIVRATADNPFVDAEEAERLIAFRNARDLAYACAFPSFGCGLPIGIGVEVMSAAALAVSHREGHEPHHREHVNEYIQENPILFPQGVPETPPEKYAPDLRLTVDTPEDFRRAEQLLELFAAEGGTGAPETPWLIAACQRLDG